MSSEPTSEQQQRAKWDLLLLDIELRTEQVRQLKRYEVWKLAATLVTAGTTLGAAIAAAVLWTAHLIH